MYNRFQECMSANQVLDAMRAPGEYADSVYILGCLQSPLTFHSQQQRAFNLIWALMEEKLKPGDRVAVIGGGLAGVTAAAAALLRNLRVTLIEKNSEVLQLQNKNTTRFVHPNLYDWPIGASELVEVTDLPCLNWTAAVAGKVISHVGRQWAEISSQLRTSVGTSEKQGNPPATLRLVCNSEITTFARAPAQTSSGEPVSRIRVSSGALSAFGSNATHHDEVYDCVIVAVGYGIEQGFTDNVPSTSYWMSDALEQVRPDRPKPFRVLIVGTGDGGLTDVLRLRINNFDQKTLHQSLSAALKAPLESLVEIDQKASEIPDRPQRQTFLHDEYLALKGRLDVTRISFRLRSDTQVALMGGLIAAGAATAAIALVFQPASLQGVHAMLEWVMR